MMSQENLSQIMQEFQGTNALVRETKDQILVQLEKHRGSSGDITYTADVKVNKGQINQMSGDYATVKYGLDEDKVLESLEKANNQKDDVIK